MCQHESSKGSTFELGRTIKTNKFNLVSFDRAVRPAHVTSSKLKTVRASGKLQIDALAFVDSVHTQRQEKSNSGMAAEITSLQIAMRAAGCRVLVPYSLL